MLNCKICENPGISIFSFSYNSPELTSFLENYYQSHCKEIQTLLKDKSYNILMCKSCQFMWQEFIPSENFLKLLYEKFIDKKSSFQKYLDNNNKFKNNFTYQIKNFLFLIHKRNLGKIKILDYGSGWGGWINIAKKYSPNIDGLEFSDSKKNYLLSNNINIITFDDLKKKKLYYDFIRCEQVLEHLSNLNEFFKLVRNITNIDGYLYLGVPNSSKLFKNIDNINLFLKKGPAQPLEHLNSFTSKSLDKLAGKYGFKRISILYIFKMYLSRNWFSFKNFKNLINNISNQTLNTVRIYQKK